MEDYLAICLESVLSQLLRDIEIIAVDDGSTDKSGNILDRYAERDSRLKVIHKTHEGVSEARNAGLEYVQGEFVGFVDADDWIDLQMYETMYHAAKDKKADIVMCGYVREFIDHSKIKNMDIEDGYVFTKQELNSCFIRKMIGPISGEAFITENLDMNSVIWNKIYNTKLVSNETFYSLKEIGSCEDLLFNLYVHSQANAITFINKSFYHYRKISTFSLTNRFRFGLVQSRLNLIKKIQEFIEYKHYQGIYQEALNNRICLGIMGLGLNIIAYDNKAGFLKKVKQIKEMLSAIFIRKALQTFDCSSLPLHWRVFYGFARNRNAVCYYFMLKSIKFLIYITH